MYCGEPYTPGHYALRHKKPQLFYLDLEEESLLENVVYQLHSMDVSMVNPH